MSGIHAGTPAVFFERRSDIELTRRSTVFDVAGAGRRAFEPLGERNSQSEEVDMKSESHRERHPIAFDAPKLLNEGSAVASAPPNICMSLEVK